MSVVQKALWFVEYSLTKPVGLEDTAKTCGVSVHHLARAFLAVVGVSPQRYLRMRRVSVAALALAKGASDILNVALAAGYGWHEAFSRAFRDAFGLTPDTLRAQGHVAQLHLQEAIRMEDKVFGNLAAPKQVRRGAFTLAGLIGNYTMDTVQGIPNL